METVSDLPLPRVIRGVRVYPLERDAALAWIIERIFARRASVVTFCNAHTANLAACDPAYQDALNSALVLNDGVGLDIASRALFGRAFATNLNGTDFTPALLARAPMPLRLYLLGSAPGVADVAAKKLAQRYSHLGIVGTHHGYFAAEEEPEIVSKIVGSGANLILVGMGQPRQEMWAVRNSEQLPAVTMCVGAYLDFVAGTVRRAPPLVRHARLEWMFRLLQEPRRLGRRYLLGNLEFMAWVVREYIRRTN